jgi:hypothetical protein
MTSRSRQGFSKPASVSASADEEVFGSVHSETCLRPRPFAEIFGNHDQLAVWVEHEHFALPSLPIADIAPDLTGSGMKRPAGDFERPRYRLVSVMSDPPTNAPGGDNARGRPPPATDYPGRLPTAFRRQSAGQGQSTRSPLRLREGGGSMADAANARHWRRMRRIGQAR